MKTYTGGCHCGAVRYEVETDLAKVYTCNCSHCEKKGLLLNFVDADKFTLKAGKESLTEYLFNKKKIRHLFCNVCGVQSYAEGIEMPKVSINVRCLDDVDIASLTTEHINGKDF